MRAIATILLILLIASIIFLKLFGNHLIDASEEKLRQAKIDCPTISKYLNLNQKISEYDLMNAVDECKQIDIQKKVFKND
ncbi:hypothetical protein OZX61_12775 (plasmid) [Acinetobacter sp. ESL0695]|uniref:hypothetical protein n=1 Tax=Acinetobacter sp. ESL0695 TaxID=2983215 RepID=UPI0023F23EA5|nr:hypothetical protein [Acinetobacter sp. ESL0695]WEV50216.1 hypothetical protein OZX61_12775 [Acinetobacter sp. ESL0695]